MSIPIFAVSIVTDMCSPEKLKAVDIPEIIDTAAKAEPKMTELIKEMIVKS
jgi:purine-nucleoside phosphorylase